MGLVLAILMFSSWTQISTSSTGAKIYIDNDSRVMKNGLARAWFSFDYSHDKTIKDREVKKLVWFNCSERTNGTASILAYDARGIVTYTENTPFDQIEFRPIVPDTVGENMLDAACATLPN